MQNLNPDTFVQRATEAGFNYINFKNYVMLQPADKPIQNYDNGHASYNQCAIGLFLKSIGIQDDLSKVTNEEILPFINGLVKDTFHPDLRNALQQSQLNTYGELQKLL